ncbi:MAG: hypothetical protein NT129_01640 [Candidatus Aenigmarchaeota archaeon]|nr:hypothetical protein [Candidatus Aenigmarchaeota archaeon]
MGRKTGLIELHKFEIIINPDSKKPYIYYGPATDITAAFDRLSEIAGINIEELAADGIPTVYRDLGPIGIFFKTKKSGKLPSNEGMKHYVTEGLIQARRVKYPIENDAQAREIVTGFVDNVSENYEQLVAIYRRLERKAEGSYSRQKNPNQYQLALLENSPGHLIPKA